MADYKGIVIDGEYIPMGGGGSAANYITGSTTKSVTISGGGNSAQAFTFDFGGRTPTKLFPVINSTFYFAIMRTYNLTATGFSLHLYNISSSSRTANVTVDFIALF